MYFESSVRLRKLELRGSLFLLGNMQNPSTIRIDGYNDIVGKELEIVLRHLRAPKHAEYLWVDVIYINQADAAEKSELVQIMHLFYSSAGPEATFMLI